MNWDNTLWSRPKNESDIKLQTKELERESDIFLFGKLY